jgi:hypothetical protein
MTNRLWITPILVICNKTGQILSVSTTKDAVDMLTSTWPQKEGNAYTNALQICANVAAGIATPDEAREAFIEAAREANVPTEIFLAL